PFYRAIAFDWILKHAQKECSKLDQSHSRLHCNACGYVSGHVRSLASFRGYWPSNHSLNMRNMLKVKLHRLGWGITDGKKWFFWAYTSEQKASEVLTKINSVITSKPKLSSSWGEE